MGKTILYVGGFELPDKNAAAHRVLNNGKIFRELGYDVVFLGISHTAEKLTKDSVSGFMVWNIPYPKSAGEWRSYLTSIEHIKEILDNIEEPAAVIFYNYQSWAMKRAIDCCKSRNIRTVADVTEWYLESKKNIASFIVKQANTSYRMRYLNKKTDGIITISTFLTDYYKKSGCGNIVQLPPLVDKEDIKWSKPETERSDNKISLVYAGSPGHKDNLPVIVRSIARLKDKAELRILGIDAEQVRKTADFGEGDGIFAYGRVSHSECLRIIKESDFQVFFRSKNLVTEAGFPTKLGESFACGIPVITNLSSNIGDFLEEGKNAVIAKDESEPSVYEALKKAAELPRERISEMKRYCAGFGGFDYRNYIEAVRDFIGKL